MPQRKHVARTSAKLCSYAPLYIRTARSVVFWLIPRMFSNFNLPFTWSNCSRVPDTKIEKNGVVMSRDVGGFTNEDNLLILRPQKCHAKYARFHLINGISSWSSLHFWRIRCVNELLSDTRCLATIRFQPEPSITNQPQPSIRFVVIWWKTWPKTLAQNDKAHECQPIFPGYHPKGIQPKLLEY